MNAQKPAQQYSVSSSVVSAMSEMKKPSSTNVPMARVMSLPHISLAGSNHDRFVGVLFASYSKTDFTTSPGLNAISGNDTRNVVSAVYQNMRPRARPFLMNHGSR